MSLPSQSRFVDFFLGYFICSLKIVSREYNCTPLSHTSGRYSQKIIYWKRPCPRRALLRPAGDGRENAESSAARHRMQGALRRQPPECVVTRNFLICDAVAVLLCISFLRGI